MVAGAFRAQPAEGGQLRLQHEGCTFLAALGGSAAPLSVRRCDASTGSGRRPIPVVCWPRRLRCWPSCSRCPEVHSLALDAFSNDQLVRFMVKPPEQKDELAPG